MSQRPGFFARLSAAEVPKGGVVALCACLLALPAALALGHEPRTVNSGSDWAHHHTLDYTTCNDINENTNWKTWFNDAKVDWRDHTILDFTNQTDCHPGPGSPRAHLEFQDGYYGSTGWRSLETPDPASAYHATHTHIQLNLSANWSNYTSYDKRALACREIGQVIGVKKVPPEQFAAHGADNDCMSFWNQPQEQVSKDENPNNYTYTDHPRAHSKELVDITYGGHAPHLDLSGSLSDAAQNKSYLVNDLYELEIRAAPSSSPDPTVGLEELVISVDGVTAATAGASCAFCAIETAFTLAPDSLVDGAHTVSVEATDTLGYSVTRHLQIHVDRRGDLYHARQFLGNPADGGELLFEEWADPTTGDSRSETPGLIVTRTAVPCDDAEPTGPYCAEMNQRTTTASMAAGAQTAFASYRGVAAADPNVGGVAWILDPAPDGDPPAATGDLKSVLAPWQVPPPGHGTEYERYEFAERTDTAPVEDPDDETTSFEAELIHRVWVDAATGLPVKTDVALSDGGTYGDTYVTYEERVERSAMGESFLRLQPGSSSGLEKYVRSSATTEPRSVVDSETGAPFTAYDLGSVATVGDRTFCLTRKDVVRMREDAEPAPVPLSGTDDEAHPSAEWETEVFASYAEAAPGHDCSSTAAEEDLVVISGSMASTLAEATSLAYKSPAGPPGTDDTPRTRSVEFESQTETAYLFDLTHDQAITQTSALIEGTDTILTVSGIFSDDELDIFLAELEPQ